MGTIYGLLGFEQDMNSFAATETFAFSFPLSVLKIDGSLDGGRLAPNDTPYTRWSCHSSMENPVQLVSTLPHPAMSFITVLGKPAMRTRWITGNAPHKSE